MHPLKQLENPFQYRLLYQFSFIRLGAVFPYLFAFFADLSLQDRVPSRHKAGHHTKSIVPPRFVEEYETDREGCVFLVDAHFPSK